MIVIDTHVLIWTTTEPSRLSKKARAAILKARQETGVCISTISLLEVARVAAAGRIIFPGSVESIVREMAARVIVIPMDPEIVAISVRLPAGFPKDPSDRVIASTAIAQGMQLVTADERIRESRVVQTIW